MRRAVVLALALVLWAGPAAAEDSQAPCALTVKRDISDEKARRRCDLPNGEVWRSYKNGRVIVFVT